MIVYSCEEVMPPSETPVLILYRGDWRIGAIFWEHPTWEETFRPFRYWDDPYNDGQEWDWDDVTHWTHLPDTSNLKNITPVLNPSVGIILMSIDMMFIPKISSYTVHTTDIRLIGKIDCDRLYRDLYKLSPLCCSYDVFEFEEYNDISLVIYNSSLQLAQEYIQTVIQKLMDLEYQVVQAKSTNKDQ